MSLQFMRKKGTSHVICVAEHLKENMFSAAMLVLFMKEFDLLNVLYAQNHLERKMIGRSTWVKFTMFWSIDEKFTVKNKIKMDYTLAK